MKHSLMGISFRKRLFSCILFIIGCSFTLLVLVYIQISSKKQLFQVLDDGSVADFLVNTPGCKMPSFDPWDPSTKVYYWRTGSYKCNGSPSFLHVKPNAVVSLDLTILQYYYEVKPEDIQCTYQVVYRAGNIDNFTIDEEFSLGDEKPLIFDIPLYEDFIKTVCINGDTSSDAKTFVEWLTLAPLKPAVEKRCEDAMKSQKTQLPNILFMGIDSVSRLNYLRHFPKTNKFLHEFLSPIVLKGYSKVGDNTFPNLMPMLTGHHYQTYWNETFNRTMYFDDVDLLWKEFSKRGYRTFYAEDTPTLNTFNYFRSGFKNPPTDYYFRPYALALEDSDERTQPCMGNKLEFAALYEYVKNFMNTMDSRPFFAFVFGVRLTHGYLNDAGYADDPAFEFIRYLHTSNTLNNTILIFFSDHGIRFGDIVTTYIGQFEERNPFMHLIFPPWFLNKYPKITKNLKTNQERLTTPFDIHETLMDLLHLDEPKSRDEPALTTPGISLFNEVSPHRTCDHASISPHYCNCQVQKRVPVDNKIVVEASSIVVRTVNWWTQRLRSKCAVLTMHEINDAHISRRTDNSRDNTGTHDYNIVLTVLPSKALLQATVRCEESDACYVVDEVSRINSYSSQSACIDDTILKKYCYCA